MRVEIRSAKLTGDDQVKPGVAVYSRKIMTVLVGAMSFLSLGLFSTPAHAEWWEAETAHFVVKSRASEDEAREYALELEQFDRTLRILQGMPLEGEDIGRANKPTVYRFGFSKDIAMLIGSSRSGVAGFFIPRAGASVGFAPVKSAKTRGKMAASMREDSRTELDPRSVLLHEYTHYFMMQHFPGAYPRWYVEGFAELMATMRVNENGSFHIGDPPQYRAYQIFQMRDFPLDEMLDPDYRLTGVDGLQHYATGWLLTHYLSFNTERLEQLRGYLKAIAQGENGLVAARREFGDLDKLQAELRRYKNGPFPGFDLTTEAAPPTVKLRALTAVEEDTIRAEMRLARGARNERDAEDLVGDLRGAIATHGSTPHLLGLMGRAQLAAERYAEAEATAEQLVTLDPDSQAGWLVRANAALGLTNKDASRAADARTFATEAAKRDRTDPRPLITYYLSYIRAGEQAPEAAITALETAYGIAGSDAIYRLLVAHQMLMDNRLDVARQVLMPIAFRGHKTAEPKDEDDPTLPRVLKLIDAGDRDAALAMTTKMIEEDDEDED